MPKGVLEADAEGRGITCGALSPRLASTPPGTHHWSPFLEASPLPPRMHVSWSPSSADFPSFSSQLLASDENGAAVSRLQRVSVLQGGPWCRRAGNSAVAGTDGGAPSSGLCLMAGRGPGCFGESEPLERVHCLPARCLLGATGWLLKGRFAGRREASVGLRKEPGPRLCALGSERMGLVSSCEVWTIILSSSHR